MRDTVDLFLQEIPQDGASQGASRTPRMERAPMGRERHDAMVVLGCVFLNLVAGEFRRRPRRVKGLAYPLLPVSTAFAVSCLGSVSGIQFWDTVAFALP
jgi:hypothetical protein